MDADSVFQPGRRYMTEDNYDCIRVEDRDGGKLIVRWHGFHYVLDVHIDCFGCESVLINGRKYLSNKLFSQCPDAYLVSPALVAWMTLRTLKQLGSPPTHGQSGILKLAMDMVANAADVVDPEFDGTEYLGISPP